MAEATQSAAMPSSDETKEAERRDDGLQVALGERRRARYQGDVGRAELGVIGKLRRGTRQLAADERAVPEQVAQTLPELAADLGDALVGGAAVWAGIAALFEQGDGRIARSQEVIQNHIHRPVEASGGRRRDRALGHPVIGRQERPRLIGQGATGPASFMARVAGSADWPSRARRRRPDSNGASAPRTRRRR
jgi:hypothetical protein